MPRCLSIRCRRAPNLLDSPFHGTTNNRANPRLDPAAMAYWAHRCSVLDDDWLSNVLAGDNLFHSNSGHDFGPLHLRPDELLSSA